MSIAIVVPSARPENRGRIIDMAARQTVLHDSLESVIFARHPSSPGAARNEGMEIARQRGFRLVSFWDDDDFYGPRYLEEQLAAWRPGRVVGKTFGLVAFNAGVVHFPLPKERPTSSLLIGGSIFGALGELPTWTDLPVAEDSRFAADCRNAGMETYLTSGRNFVYSRLGPRKLHTYRATDGLVFQNAGGLGIPTSLTPEQAMMAEELPAGEAIDHLRWEEEHGAERGRHRVPA